MEASMRIRLVASVLGLAIAAAVPFVATPAQAWWGPYYGYGWRAPVVVAPPVAYLPPPVVYAPPRAVWVAPYWYGGRYYPGHWR